MDKQTFITLATGYIQQTKLEDDLLNSFQGVARDYDLDTDFVGLPIFYGPAQQAISDAIHEIDEFDTFQYFVYDCDADFDKFNRGITLEDGSHPDVDSLDSLYYYIVAESAGL